MIAVHSASGQDRQTRHKQAQPIKARHSRSQRSPNRSTLCVLRCILRDGLRWMCCVAALLRTELRCPWATVRLEREHLAHRWRRADRSEALHSTEPTVIRRRSPSARARSIIGTGPEMPAAAAARCGAVWTSCTTRLRSSRLWWLITTRRMRCAEYLTDSECSLR